MRVVFLWSILIISACSNAVSLEKTEAAKFHALNSVLPTASKSDTTRTKTEVGTFRKLFLALCPEDVCA